MSRQVKLWAIAARAQLIEQLGGCCANCGTETALQFDCIAPQGHDHHCWSTDKRMTFYRRQHEAGNVQILCAACNNEKSRADKKLLQSREMARPVSALEGYMEAARKTSRRRCPQFA